MPAAHSIYRRRFESERISNENKEYFVTSNWKALKYLKYTTKNGTGEVFRTKCANKISSMNLSIRLICLSDGNNLVFQTISMEIFHFDQNKCYSYRWDSVQSAHDNAKNYLINLIIISFYSDSDLAWCETQCG